MMMMIEKRVVDFLLVLIELFCYVLPRRRYEYSQINHCAGCPPTGDPRPTAIFYHAVLTSKR